MPIQIAINNVVKGEDGSSGGIPRPTNFLLQEDGGKILLQNGIDFLLTEA
jgi:hypothetical protein